MPDSSEIPPSIAAPARRAGIAAAVLTTGGFVLLLLLMLCFGLRRGMNHDEVLPLAGGAVFAKHLLLPYRDYPYFHTPDLVFIYGLIFKCCGWVLLPARIFSVVMGWVTVLLVWLLVRRECAGKPFATRWLLPAAAALLIFSNPVFRDAFWRTWNHALATLFGLAATACALRPGKRASGFWAGAFIGLAIGTRLSFAPMFAPLAIAVTFAGEPGIAHRFKRLGVFCAGAAVALLPCEVLFAVAPKQFLYGNFTFNSTTNILYREASHNPNATLRTRLFFPFTDLLPDWSNRLLGLMLLFFLVAAAMQFSRWPREIKYRLCVVLALLPFVFIGAFAPQVTQNEYYYPFVPLVVLAIGIAAAPLCSRKGAWLVLPWVVIPAVLTTAWTWKEYQWLDILRRPAGWPAVMLHEDGVESARLVGQGPVLTLEPIIPAEGGLDIYPSLVTGGIAWRAEPFVPPEDRAPLLMMGPDNYTTYLEQTPPAAILTTPRSSEPELLDWTRTHAFKPHIIPAHGKLVDEATLWTPPALK